MTAFIVISYVIIVNPSIISHNGASPELANALFISTCLSSAVGCLLMGMIALMSMMGIIVLAVLVSRKVKGACIYSILAISAFAFMTGNIDMMSGQEQILSESFSDFMEFSFLQLDFYEILINGISQITTNSWNEIDNYGTLYISCNPTVVSIDLENPFINKHHLRTVITYIEIDDQKYYKDLDTIIVPSGAERLTIHFANLTYINNKASTITLIGENAYGTENSEINTIKVSKLTYWYKTYIARTIYIISGIGVLTYVMFSYFNLRMKEEIKKKEEYRNITHQAITAIASTIDAKDTYTNGHSIRVADYSLMIGKRMGYTTEQLEELYYTALLHDIGKLGIPDAILKKTSRLTSDEFQVIQSHPEMGVTILKDITMIQDLARGAKFHHERYDGGGYPNHLVGEDIPLIARIICIADAFDAMTSKRSYSTDGTLDWVIGEIKQCTNKQFDPKIVTVFIDILENNEITLP